MSIKKLVIGLAVVAMAFTVTVASADQISDLTAQINALMAQIGALQGGAPAGTSASHTYTVDLTIGSTGADVTALQTFLVSKGMLVMPAGVPMGYFGPLTKAAVAKYQASVGIAPAVGYVGPLTRANLNSLVAPVTPGTGTGTGTGTGSAGLEGDSGDLASVSKISQYDNKEVGAGQEDVIVAGAELEASNDGDIAITAMKITFAYSGTGSTRMNRYFDRVSIWMGDEEVGSADVDDFSKSSSGSTYTKTISLDDAIIRAGDKEKFYIKVDGASVIDTGDLAKVWTVDLVSTRFEDGSGVVLTDTTAYAVSTIDVVSYATAADTKLRIQSASGNPTTGTVVVSATADTNDVLLLKGKLKLDGTSDVVIDQFPVTFTVAGTSNTMDDLVGTAYLILDGEEYSESPTTSGLASTVTFDNLDFTMEAGDTIDFEVRVDLLEVDGNPAAEGDTIVASITATNRLLMDVENDAGDQLTDSTEKTGTLTGSTQTVRTGGISVTKVSEKITVSAGTGASDDQGTFELRFRVTNVGDDPMYVSSLVAATTTTAVNELGKVLVIVDRAGEATVGGVTVSMINNTDTTKEVSGTYAIEAGQSEEFTVTAIVTLPSAGSAGGFRLNLGAVAWDTSSADATPDTANFTTDLGIGESVSTSVQGLN